MLILAHAGVVERRREFFCAGVFIARYGEITVERGNGRDMLWSRVEDAGPTWPAAQ
jgi:hypothetical protein